MQLLEQDLVEYALDHRIVLSLSYIYQLNHVFDMRIMLVLSITKYILFEFDMIKHNYLQLEH